MTQETGDAKKEAGAAKKKLGFISKLLKKFSKEAQQAKKLEKESRDSLQVFGWHVYWLDSTLNNYNYNSLSTLSYYACFMTRNETGLQYSTPKWNSQSTSKMIKLARRDDCTVLLTLKCTDEAAIGDLLDNNNVQKKHINFLMNLIDSVQHADGINIIFDNIPQSHAVTLTQYVKNLSSRLKPAGKYLVLALPSMDFGSKYDIKQLEPYVDQFIVQGYNYHDKNGNEAGPVAPLEDGQKWGIFGITRSVNSYLRAGLPKNKFMLALPYYGALWRIDTLRNGKTKHVFIDHHRYSKIMEKLDDQQSDYDSTSHTMIGRFTENGKTYLYFYENEKTLSFKYNWVKRKGLAGVAIWALGYDDKRDELWQHIEKHVDVVKLPANTTSTTSTGAGSDQNEDNASTQNGNNSTTQNESNTATQTDDGAAAGSDKQGKSLAAKINTPTFFEEYNAVLTNAKVLLVGGITLIIFIILGAIKSLFYPEVYSKLIINDFKVYLKVTAIFMLIFISLLFTAKLVFQDVLLAEEIDQLDSEVELYKSVKKCLWITGTSVWIGIQLFSIKTFLRLNSDLP